MGLRAPPDPLDRHAVGDFTGRHPFRIGPGENLRQRVAEPRGQFKGAVERIAFGDSTSENAINPPALIT